MANTNLVRCASTEQIYPNDIDLTQNAPTSSEALNNIPVSKEDIKSLISA
jgi:hypothetical protein